MNIDVMVYYKKKLNNLRERLNRMVSTEGHTKEELLEASRELDELMIQYLKKANELKSKGKGSGE